MEIDDYRWWHSVQEQNILEDSLTDMLTMLMAIVVLLDDFKGEISQRCPNH